MTSPTSSTHNWWRRLSLGPPDDVNCAHFRALRQRGFNRQESHAALCEAGNNLDAAFHAAIRLRHKTHTGSPYLYDGCDLCDEEKLRYAAKRAGVLARRESVSSEDEIIARKAEAVEKWRERNAGAISPPAVSLSLEKTNPAPRTRSLSCGDRQQCIRWCCPRDPHDPPGLQTGKGADDLEAC